MPKIKTRDEDEAPTAELNFKLVLTFTFSSTYLEKHRIKITERLYQENFHRFSNSSFSCWYCGRENSHPVLCLMKDLSKKVTSVFNIHIYLGISFVCQSYILIPIVDEIDVETNYEEKPKI